MEPQEYTRMFELEDHHWWFQSRLMMTEGVLRRAILPALGPGRPRMLDLGCGTGLWLARRFEHCEAYGIDFAPEALSFCRSRGLVNVALANAVKLPFPDGRFDIVTAFDLIEHLPDDAALIREIHRVLRPGGFLLATVPAHPILWSGHDISLHHHRRYRRREFEALFESGLWETVRMSASFTLIFLPAMVIRLWRRLTAAHRPPQSDTHATAPWLNRLMIALHRPEAAWITRHDLPIGISLLTVQRKHER